jgi:hypothetical protein
VGLLDRPTLASPGREPGPHQSGSPTDSSRWHRRKKEKDPHLHTDKIKITKSKGLSDYTQQDLSVVTRRPPILDMQRLQVK